MALTAAACGHDCKQKVAGDEMFNGIPTHSLDFVSNAFLTDTRTVPWSVQLIPAHFLAQAIYLRDSALTRPTSMDKTAEITKPEKQDYDTRAGCG